MSNANPALAHLQSQPLLKRLTDPQVWVCAIAAFTLIGLSSGLLGASEKTARDEFQVASSAQAGK